MPRWSAYLVGRPLPTAQACVIWYVRVRWITRRGFDPSSSPSANPLHIRGQSIAVASWLGFRRGVWGQIPRGTDPTTASRGGGIYRDIGKIIRNTFLRWAQ